ncbi:unnamed protein product [Prorocentrum cordatum]|uniref:Uncharacterized protein n=1 Tax=Prorocentrum cordatum TaxID=2364126 RepID=A0ABN9RE72_9DINO|nr:unnamed protein product [Polarella glacialis]
MPRARRAGRLVGSSGDGLIVTSRVFLERGNRGGQDRREFDASEACAVQSRLARSLAPLVATPWGSTASGSTWRVSPVRKMERRCWLSSTACRGARKSGCLSERPLV